MSVPTARDFRDCVRLLFLCGGWYAVSSANGVIGKWILSEFPYPVTLTMVQLLSITLYSKPLMHMLSVRPLSISWPYYFRLIVPLAFAKFLFGVMSHVSIWKVPVSYAHTVKATMPLFTVILSRLIMKERHSMKVYASLMPIVGGVAVATLTEVSFHPIGLGAALCSASGFSLINIFSKKVIKESGVHHLRLLYVLGRLALFMFLPVWMFSDLRNVWTLTKDQNTNFFSIALLLGIDGFLHWMQNIFAFSILKLVAPLTYAVANVTKRISIITVSLLLLGNPVTLTNVFGMFLAIFGVFFYNKAKYEENRAKTDLPTKIDRSTSMLVLNQPFWQVRDQDIHRLKLENGSYRLNGYSH